MASEFKGDDPTPKTDGYLRELDKVITFYETSQDDSHGINRAVMVSVLEVRNAYAKAKGFPTR